MKLTASMMLTVDGVYQGPGGPDEDRRDGFERGGWTAAHADEETGRFLTSLVRARGRAAPRAPDLGDLRELLAAPRRGRSGLARHQRPAQVRAVDHAQGSGLEHPRDRWRRRGGGARAQGEARARAPAPRQRRAAPLAARARPRRRAQPADQPRRGGRRAAALPGARPDARPGIGRIAFDAVRRDAPDLSSGRSGNLRQRGRVTPRHRHASHERRSHTGATRGSPALAHAIERRPVHGPGRDRPVGRGR